MKSTGLYLCHWDTCLRRVRLLSFVFSHGKVPAELARLFSAFWTRGSSSFCLLMDAWWIFFTSCPQRDVSLSSFILVSLIFGKTSKRKTILVCIPRKLTEQYIFFKRDSALFHWKFASVINRKNQLDESSSEQQHRRPAVANEISEKISHRW